MESTLGFSPHSSLRIAAGHPPPVTTARGPTVATCRSMASCLWLVDPRPRTNPWIRPRSSLQPQRSGRRSAVGTYRIAYSLALIPEKFSQPRDEPLEASGLILRKTNLVSIRDYRPRASRSRCISCLRGLILVYYHTLQRTIYIQCERCIRGRLIRQVYLHPIHIGIILTRLT